MGQESLVYEHVVGSLPPYSYTLQLLFLIFECRDLSVTFRLGPVMLHERSIRTNIGTVFVHISYFPPTLVASLLSYVVSCDV
jgi:hypothetical protein